MHAVALLDQEGEGAPLARLCLLSTDGHVIIYTTLCPQPGLKDKNIIVQGLGNVGFYAAHFCSKAGAKVTGTCNLNQCS